MQKVVNYQQPKGSGFPPAANERIISMNSENQTAIVTGGSGGIGRAVCRALAEKGIHVVINYSHNEAAAKETERLCRECGVQTLLVQADISDSADCDRMFREAQKLTGRIDILVNNAGITKDSLLLMMKEEDFDRVIHVNLYGAFYCMKKASRIMLRQKYGRIVSISSIVGIHGNPGQVNYAASKAGIIGMTKSLAKELAGRNITVNAVAPGMIDTEMTEALSDAAKEAMLAGIPMGRAGKAEEVAAAVAFLASEEASYITGQVLGADGGMGC